MGKPPFDPDETAAVVDQHTGRVRARFQGLGATEDAKKFARDCKGVYGFGSTSVVTGNKARKAIQNGRV